MRSSIDDVDMPEKCVYFIPNYEFGPHDKEDACSRAYKEGYTMPYTCRGICQKARLKAQPKE